MGIDDKISDLQTIVKMAERVLNSQDLASEWIKTPLADLNGDTPQNHILQNKPDAFEKVKQILIKIEHGIY